MCTTSRSIFSAGFLGSFRTKIAFWLTVGACRKEFGADAVALAVTVDVDGRDETLNPTVFGDRRVASIGSLAM